MISVCAAIVDKVFDCYMTWKTTKYGSDVQPLRKVLYRITSGKLVRLILDCTVTTMDKKNWNSHDATLELAMCELSLILSELCTASTIKPPSNFIEYIPHGVGAHWS